MSYSDSKVHVANMGPTWVLSAPGGPHIGSMNLAITVASLIMNTPPTGSAQDSSDSAENALELPQS